MSHKYYGTLILGRNWVFEKMGVFLKYISDIFRSGSLCEKRSVSPIVSLSHLTAINSGDS